LPAAGFGHHAGAKLAKDAAHRLITLYSVYTDPVQGLRAVGTLVPSEESTIFGPIARGERSVLDRQTAEPSIHGVRKHDPSRFTVGGEPPKDYSVVALRTYFFLVPNVGTVLALDMNFAGDLRGCILAQRDAFDPLADKQIGGNGLLAGATEGLNANVEWGLDTYQLLAMDPIDLVLRPGARSSEGIDLNEIDDARLRRLMLKNTDIVYRPEKVPISFPQDLNGPARLVVAMWASNTVVGGLDAYGELGRRRLAEMTRVAAQIVAASGAIRAVRARTEKLLIDLRTDEPALTVESVESDLGTRRTGLTDVASELGWLELDLEFGVQTLRGPALVWGGRPLEQYQKTLREEVGFDASASAAGQMLDRASTIIEARRAALDTNQQFHLIRITNELLTRTGAAKTVAAVGAAVLSVVAATTLFAALATVPASSSWLHPVLRNAALAALVVVGSAVFGYLLWQAAWSAPRRGPAWRGLSWTTGLSALACLVVVMCQFKSVAQWTSEILGIGVAMAAVTTLLIGMQGDFGPRRGQHLDL
jgi:hypothetical protein